MLTPPPSAARNTALTRLLAAAGIAAVMGAAGLGVGYAVGIFSWLPGIDGAGKSAWLGSLTWTVWTTAVTVVIAAVTTSRHTDTLLERLSIVLAAALGTTVGVVLTAVPARGADRPDTFAPHVLVAGHAIAGLVIGLLIALAAVTSHAIAANAIATTAWCWLVAVVAALDGQVWGADGWHPVSLGIWHFTDYGLWWLNMYLPAAGFTLGASLLIGALTAWPAARRGANRVLVIVSGATGPALVAAAYAVSTLGQPGLFADQTSMRLIALYAIAAGLLGSAIAATLAGNRSRASVPTPA